LQIEPIVAAMRPANEELVWAEQILPAAQEADWGPIRFDGELHDRATYRYFWSILRKAHATGMPAGGATRRRWTRWEPMVHKSAYRQYRKKFAPIHLCQHSDPGAACASGASK